jgi:hypothetical protein
MLLYTLYIAAMTGAGLRAVYHIGLHALDVVVRGVAIGKTVGHEHIEHITGIKPLAVGSRTFTLAQFVRQHILFLAFLLQSKLNRTRLRIGDIQIDKEIILAIQAHHTVHLHTRSVGSHRRIAYPLAIKHDLQGRIFHTGKPIGRVYLVNLNLRSRHKRSYHSQ